MDPHDDYKGQEPQETGQSKQRSHEVDVALKDYNRQWWSWAVIPVVAGPLLGLAFVLLSTRVQIFGPYSMTPPINLPRDLLGLLFFSFLFAPIVWGMAYWLKKRWEPGKAHESERFGNLSPAALGSLSSVFLGVFILGLAALAGATQNSDLIERKSAKRAGAAVAAEYFKDRKSASFIKHPVIADTYRACRTHTTARDCILVYTGDWLPVVSRDKEKKSNKRSLNE